MCSPGVSLIKDGIQCFHSILKYFLLCFTSAVWSSHSQGCHCYAHRIMHLQLQTSVLFSFWKICTPIWFLELYDDVSMPIHNFIPKIRLHMTTLANAMHCEFQHVCRKEWRKKKTQTFLFKENRTLPKSGPVDEVAILYNMPPILVHLK